MEEPVVPAITLIGVGGIGTALLPLLARLHPAQVTLWDNDIVNEHNLVNQFLWRTGDVGKHKALVAGSRLAEATVAARAVPRRYEGIGRFDTIVIAAVDSMESRRLVWNGAKGAGSGVQLFFDGRLSRETPFYFQLFAIRMDDSDAREAYEGWLEGDGEPDTGRRNFDMVPAPLVLSGVIGTLIVRWSRKMDLPWQVIWDGASMSLVSH
ncbi:MAG TPA: ThiF family adenylyltransferase [Candidatus Paceibacterota bacterium]|nr:ThiF family adenylyltransferase [Candidatus Paceibacterota bacterium]